MLTDYLPIFRLRLRSERLVLRLPDFDDLAALADVAAAGIHGLDAVVLTLLGLGTEPTAGAGSGLDPR